MTERRLADEAARWLEDAGFIVQREVELGATKSARSAVRADIVAWEAGPAGLVPAILVEVKRRTAGPRPPELLGQLEAYQSLTHAAQALVFDGSWWTRDASGASLVPTKPPTPRGDLSPSEGSDAPLRRAILSEVWATLDENRREGITASAESLGGVLEQLIAQRNSFVSHVLSEARSAELVFEVVKSLLPRLAVHGGQLETADPLNECVAALARARTGTVFDPFCGVGGTLLAVHREAKGAGQGGLELVGRERVREIATLARLLFETAHVEARITTGDSIAAGDTGVADTVVSDPPLNIHLQQPVTLTSGEATQDGTAVGVNTCVRALRDGGRAVVITSPSFLWRQGTTQKYRDWLARTHRVAAILRFPAGTASNTAVPPVVLVIERRPPTLTLFATLGDDWSSQLAPDGALFSAYLRHLEQQ